MPGESSIPALANSAASGLPVSALPAAAPQPGPAPVPDGSPGALLLSLREDLLYGPTAPILAVLLTFSLMVLTMALYVGLCVAIFAI